MVPLVVTKKSTVVSLQLFLTELRRLLMSWDIEVRLGNLGTKYLRIRADGGDL